MHITVKVVDRVAHALEQANPRRAVKPHYKSRKQITRCRECGGRYEGSECGVCKIARMIERAK